MLSITLQNNKRNYQQYNEWRKQQFLANSPKDAAVILYMLPWLLNVNQLGVPGYIREMKKAFKVFNIEKNMEILAGEYQFKKGFGWADERFSVRNFSGDYEIQGLYTIGSVGTISQTSRSDCDIWICIDRKLFDDKHLNYLNQKLNLIKGWLDERVKIPVYFFLTDVEDIQKCNFGNIDFESSGSAQKNVLKEEFYRTSILICGKIPFWWVAYDPAGPVDYEQTFTQNQTSGFREFDVIDFGSLEKVNQSEYYGAALWQLNKSLTHPLKSIIKMLLLKMFLESPEDDLLCNKFRAVVLNPDRRKAPPDPSLFTMQEVLDYYSTRVREDHFEFIKKCFYLRYDLKLMSRKQTHKDEMAVIVFSKYKIDRRDIYALNEFDSWDLDKQVDFGGLMFEYVTDIYRDIISIQKGLRGEIARNDLTIIGRKLASSMSVKNFKVPILHISSETIAIPSFLFAFKKGMWQVYASHDTSSPVIANEDIVYCLAYIVWNGIFDPLQIRMQPNPTPVTIQEIINLGKMMRDVFGTYDIAQVHFSKFLAEETINKMLVTISFEEASTGMDIQNISIIYKNNWEEIFVRRFSSLEKMKTFLTRAGKISPRVETFYYIQRNNKYYEKIIDRTKNIIAQIVIGR
ncbi:MAG: class I adenylate cyclase [Deltaproteobacteria bacterium]